MLWMCDVRIQGPPSSGFPPLIPLLAPWYQRVELLQITLESSGRSPRCGGHRCFASDGGQRQTWPRRYVAWNEMSSEKLTRCCWICWMHFSDGLVLQIGKVMKVAHEGPTSALRRHGFALSAWGAATVHWYHCSKDQSLYRVGCRVADVRPCSVDGNSVKKRLCFRIISWLNDAGWVHHSLDCSACPPQHPQQL